MPSYLPTLIVVILFFLASLIHTSTSKNAKYCCKAYLILSLEKLSTLQVTPIFRSLHWLSTTHYHITFKVLLIIYKILLGQAPKYLSDLIFLAFF